MFDSHRVYLEYANGQLGRKAKVVREPKSYMDMAIPCRNYTIIEKIEMCCVEDVETSSDECRSVGVR